MNVTEANRRAEGRATRVIEKQTSRAPSGFFLTLAIGSMAASAAILLSDQFGRRSAFERRNPFGRAKFGRANFARGSFDRHSGLATFVGQWAPTLLIMGLYNKVVKLEREIFPDVLEEEGR